MDLTRYKQKAIKLQNRKILIILQATRRDTHYFVSIIAIAVFNQTS